MSVVATVVMAGLDPAIHRANDAAIFSMMDARGEPAHDVWLFGDVRPHRVIPGRAKREPGMTRERLPCAAKVQVEKRAAKHVWHR